MKNRLGQAANNCETSTINQTENPSANLLQIQWKLTQPQEYNRPKKGKSLENHGQDQNQEVNQD